MLSTHYAPYILKSSCTGLRISRNLNFKNTSKKAMGQCRQSESLTSSISLAKPNATFGGIPSLSFPVLSITTCTHLLGCSLPLCSDLMRQWWAGGHPFFPPLIWDTVSDTSVWSQHINHDFGQDLEHFWANAISRCCAQQQPAVSTQCFNENTAW